MNFTYENQGTNTYLVYEIGANDALDSMSLGMLTNNDIHGLAKTLFTQMDEKKFIRYNVSAKVSGAQFFTGVVNRKRLLGVFKGIVDAMLSAEEYMLDPDSIVLDMNYIFADVSTCETVLICLPVAGADLPKTDLSTFFRNIMFSTQFDQTENCDHVTHILNHLNRTPVLSLPEFKNLLDSLSTVQEPARSVPQKPQPEAPRSAAQPQKVVQTPPAPVQPAASGARQVVPPAPKAPVAPVAPPPAAPVMKPAPAPVPQAPQNPSGEKDISLFYLLQHYNKENAAAYKAQKEAKKGQTAKADGKKAAKQEKQEKKEKKEKKQKKQKEQAAPKMASPSFAIPGQPDRPAAPPAQQIPPVQPPVTVKPVQPQAAQPVVPQPQMTPPPVQVQQAPVQSQTWQPIAKEGKAINFGETTVLGEQVGGTVILGAAAAAKTEPHLIRMKNNEKIPIDKPVFRIGKERNYADYFIADNPSVSRSHANIITRDGELFVVDTNSTNRTYVDGVAISSNVETKLAHGTKLRFANEDFEFRLY